MKLTIDATKRCLAIAGLLLSACQGLVTTETITSVRAIGPEGGEVYDDGVHLTIPSDVLTETTTIAILESSTKLDGQVGAIYEMEPKGLVLSKPARINITLSAEDLDGLEDWPDHLELASIVGEVWTPLATTEIDEETLTVSAETLALGVLGVVYVPEAHCITEVCNNGEDDDCDGETDEGCPEPCTCDLFEDVCETSDASTATLCECDPDCTAEVAPCSQDGYCDTNCPYSKNAEGHYVIFDDPDCTPCDCNYFVDVCDVGEACSYTPCSCDPDCSINGGDYEPCTADGLCDTWCPSKDYDQWDDPDCEEKNQSGQQNGWCF